MNSLECTIACQVATAESQKKSYLSMLVKWLGSLKIEGAENISKTK